MKNLLFFTYFMLMVSWVNSQSLPKNSIKYTPTRLMNTYRAPGHLFSYERQLNKYHSLELSFLKMSNLFSESGNNYTVNNIKGSGIGASYRFNFLLLPLQKLFFGSTPFQFYISPNILYSKAFSSLEWTFIDDNEQPYLDAFTLEQTMRETYLLFGSKCYFDKKHRFSIEVFTGLGQNIGEIIHTGRENLLHEAEILAEWDYTVFWPESTFNYMGLKSGISFNYSF